MQDEQDRQERFLAMLGRIVELEMEGRYQDAFEECQRCLSEAGLNEVMRKRIEYKCAVLGRAIDPNYSPPSHYPPEEYEPLLVHSQEALRQGNYNQALIKAWDYMQYLASGSYPLQHALAHIAECALKAGEEELAKAAAHLFVTHLTFMEVASRNPLTPISPRTPREQWQPMQKPVTEVVFAIPEETAFRFILEEEHPDWPAILEMAAQVTAQLTHPDLHPSVHLLRILEALVHHYQKFGKQEALQALLQRYPEARRYLQEGGA